MKPFRIALAVFFSLLAVSAAIVVILFLRTDPNKVFHYFSDQIENNLSLRISAGDARLDLLKGIELSNVRIIDTSSGKSNSLATFEQGRILYNPIALLWSKIDILSVSASGIRITFDDLQNLVSNMIAIAGRSTNSENSVGVLIRSISVDSSVLVFNGVPFGVKGAILFGELLDDSVLRGEFESGHGKIGFGGKLNGMDVTIQDLDISALTGIKEKILLNSVRAKLDKISDSVYRFSGDKADITYMDYSATAISPFTGRFNMETGELSLGDFKLRSGRSVFYAEVFRTSTVRQDLEMRISGIQADLPDFLHGAEGIAYGSIGVRSFSNVLVSGDLQVSNANFQVLRRISGTIKITNNGYEADLAGGAFGGNFSASLKGTDLFGGAVQLNVLMDQLNLDNLAVSGTNSSSKESNKEPLPSYTVNGQVSIGRIVYKKFQTGKSELKFTVSSSGVRLTDGQCEFLKGKLGLKGNYTDGIFSGEAVLADAKMKEFTALFLDSGKKLYGTVSGKGIFRLDTRDPFLSTGDINLQVRDGEIKDVFIQNKVSAVLFDIPLDDIFFDSIELNGKMADGILDVKGFRFSSENIRMNATGQMGLRGQDLSFRSEIFFNKDYLSGLPNVAQIFTSGYDRGDGQVAFGIAVNGTLKNPSVQIEKTK
jgi:hypothetical protein